MFLFFTVSLILVIVAALYFVSAQFFNVMFRGFPPFLPTRDKIIARVISDLNLDSQDVVYELGGGRVKFLRGLARKFPEARYVGIEYSFLPYLLGSLQAFISRDKIKIIKKNFFKVNLSEATLIYFYLLPEVMARLSAKIKQECRPGTKIVSYQFSVPGLNLDKLSATKNDRIYFYHL